ncbi:MAG: hypothetical protein JKY53_06465 [Flavobacteriales bacterium]|nr:hypothetical protein [Flavobacteriales bacterium]
MTLKRERQIDIANIVLLGISLVVAIKLPFALFLFAYAILGPLHYLTEIVWLKEKNFFSKSKSTPILLIGLSVMLTIVYLLLVYYNSETASMKKVLLIIYSSLIVFAIILGSSSIFNLTKKWIIGLISATVLFILLFKDSSIYSLIFASFFTSIVHVFIFTGAFMLYGARKSKSKLGYLSVALLFICGISIFFIPINPSDYSFSKDLREAYNGSKFTILHFQLSQLFYSVDKTNFSLINEIGIKVQAFIAFIYTYHYLNWFSKTSVIGWHKVSWKWLLFCGIIWASAVGLYFIDYEKGLVTLFFISLLHVLLEIPLNTKCFVDLFSRK